MEPNPQLLSGVEELFASSEQNVIMVQWLQKSEDAASVWNPLAFNKKQGSKPRILAITAKRNVQTQKFKVNIHVIKEDERKRLSLSRTYKLKHLIKIEAVQADASGRTFILHFDNHKPGNPVPQWTSKGIDERNQLLVCLVRMCRDNGKKPPSFIGIDLVEVALWAQAHAEQLPAAAGGAASGETTNIMGDMDLSGAGGKVSSKGGQDLEMVTAKEEEDMEELLGMYVMGIDEADAFSERLKRELTALENANVHAILESEPMVEQVLQKLDEAADTVNDMEQWLAVFNIKLKHMREDIESIESRNNRLEMQAQNTTKLMAELERVMDTLRLPPEYASLLSGGPFEEPCMPQNLQACEWLASALAGLDPPHLDAEYSQMKAVREKRAEVEQLKATFVRRAVAFLANYLAHIADAMINDRNHFSSRGLLKKPDHSQMRYRLRTYARLVQILKELDKRQLPVLRKQYCQSMNLLLRREAREFANELKSSAKVPKSPQAGYMDNMNSPTGVETGGTADTFSRMLRTFVPLILDEMAFFASYFCFEISTPGLTQEVTNGVEDDDDITPMSLDDGEHPTPFKGAADTRPEDLRDFNAHVMELLEGFNEEFSGLVDWACRLDPLQAIALQGMTERWIESHGSDDNVPLIKRLLMECQSRIRAHFSRFVEEVNHSIEKYDKGIKQSGVLPYMRRFPKVAAQMEGLIQGRSREVVDEAYVKLIGTMFTVLEHIALSDPKHADVLLLENYAAFQDDLYDLAMNVTSLAKYYQQASNSYETACTRYINGIINYQFGRFFQYFERIETLLYTLTPEEVPFQLGFNKVDLRKLLKTTLNSVERQIRDMHKRMQKHLTADHLLQSLWEKCQEDFMDRYEAAEAVMAKCYPSEQLSPSSSEMRELFKVA